VETERKLLAVTPADIQRVACHCLHRSRLAVAVVGPVKGEEKIRGWLA
jgi:predicted Zn-dependent peptidase